MTNVIIATTRFSITVTNERVRNVNPWQCGTHSVQRTASRHFILVYIKLIAYILITPIVAVISDFHEMAALVPFFNLPPQVRNSPQRKAEKESNKWPKTLIYPCRCLPIYITTTCWLTVFAMLCLKMHKPEDRVHFHLRITVNLPRRDEPETSPTNDATFEENPPIHTI